MASRTGARLALSLVSLCLVAELVGVIAYFVDTGALFYTDRRTYPDLLPAPENQLMVGEAVHPYFGPTHKPGIPFDIPQSLLPSAQAPSRLKTNNFGFVSPYDYPFRKTSDRQFVIGLFGGSVGLWFCEIGAPRLLEDLKRDRAFADRDLVPLCFSHEGYKQPQQALVLAYFLSIGQRFDLVVNIDGFNDVALASLNNEHGLDISMPSAQHIEPLVNLVNQATLTPEKLESLATIIQARERLTTVRQAIAANRIASVNLVLDRYYRWVQGNYVRELGRFSNLPSNPAANTLIQVTPPVKSRATDTLYADIADLWASSSVLMHDILNARGAQYFHFLQPNQYYTTRRFPAEEAAIALNEDSPYRGSVEKGYPVLIAAAQSALSSRRIRFFDATHALDREPGPVYMDNCCHYTLAGNRALADFVATSILESR